MTTATRLRKLEKLLNINDGSYTLPSVDDVINTKDFLFITQNPKYTRQERGAMRHFVRQELKKETRTRGLTKAHNEGLAMSILLRFTISYSSGYRGVGNFETKRNAIEQKRITQRAF